MSVYIDWELIHSVIGLEGGPQPAETAPAPESRPAGQQEGPRQWRPSPASVSLTASPLVAYDIEVFSYCWIVVCQEADENGSALGGPHVFTSAEPGGLDQLARFIESHYKSVWIGFNNKNYDRWILQAIQDFKGDPLEVKAVNDALIGGEAGHRLSLPGSGLSKNLIQYDISESFMAGSSLKQLEGFLGHSIIETSVPFDLDRPLSAYEVAESVEYCKNDVAETLFLFGRTISDYRAKKSVIQVFELPEKWLSKSKTGLAVAVLGGRKLKAAEIKAGEWDIQIPDTLRAEKYKTVLEWFMEPSNYCETRTVPQKRNPALTKTEKNQLVTQIGGAPAVFGWGGVHVARNSYHSTGYFLNMDVSSLYPSIMIRYPAATFPRGVDQSGRERYSQIKATRLQLKEAGKKAEQAPYKIILNGFYGSTKAAYYESYDPRATRNVCVHGQLLVGVDLAERVEPFGEIVQINTDGLLLKLNSPEAREDVLEAAHEWERRTGLSLDFDDYGQGEVWQRDISTYVIKGENGQIKGKGALALREWDKCNCPVLYRAALDYLTKGTPIEQTILEEQDLMQFQKIIKLPKNGAYFLHNGQRLNERVCRVFASRDATDTPLTYYSTTSHKEAKPGSADYPLSGPFFIDNGHVAGAPVPERLNREWYIDSCKKFLRKAFGPDILK